MSVITSKVKQEKLLELLSDRQWHSGEEIATKVGFRFAATLHQIRKQGYSIETREANNQFEYRVLSGVVSLDESELPLITEQTDTDHCYSIDDLKSFLPQILERLPYLRILVLFGSRARGDNNLNSDWDFAVLYDQKLRQNYEQGGWDCVRGWVIFEQILQLPENKVDFVILNECSDLLAHVIARDGKLLYEQESGEFEAFRKKSLKTNSELKQIEQQEKDFLELELQKW
jgi:uncharacterized protein